MQSKDSKKHFVIAFFIALAVYLVSYHYIEGSRSKKGAWEVTFSSGPDNPPTLQITQTNLRISGVKIVFTGASAPATNARVVFDRAQEVPFSTPFGQCVFQDIIFEPGTVVLGFAGHQVQLMRRILTLDGTEYSWTNRLISLPAK